MNLETFTDITGTIAFNTTTTISNTSWADGQPQPSTGDAGQVGVSLNSRQQHLPASLVR